MRKKAPVRASRKKAAAETFPIVGVGASAGGLEAFRELLENLPERPGMAFVLIQHLDPTSPAELLGKSLFEVDGGAWNIPRLRERLEEVASSGEQVLNIDAPLRIPRLGAGRPRIRLDARKVQPEEAGEPMLLLVVSERHGDA